MNTNKNSKQEKIMDKIDRAINELVYEKTTIIKAYNYYHAKRDPEQFRHLEENYGIGTPTSVEFVPLVKKHIDVLIGEYLTTPVAPKVSCKDKETISNIGRQKQLVIGNSVIKELKKHLQNTLYNAINSDPSQEKGQSQDMSILKEIEAVKESTQRNFISDYEIAGQNIIDYSMLSRALDFSNKRKTLLTDLLVSGTCYYKVIPSSANTNVELVVLNPINTFIDRNPESVYLNESYRSVVRNHYTKHQILNKFGKNLSKDDLEKIEDIDQYTEMSDASTYVRAHVSTVSGDLESEGILGGYEVTPIMPFDRNTSKHYRLYPVYEVEWLEAEKEDDDFIMYRHEGVRINNNIYITTGKSENIVRSMDAPNECTLTVNGMFYSDRNGDPFSLVISTANLQDKFDCLQFYRDNVIAESGSTGDWMDIAHLPKFLGNDVTERLMKWKAYKKSGLALFDSSQEGEPMNTTFGGFDDTIKLDTIQALDLAITRVEETCSTITGVFREKLGGIEQRDAVSNIKVGVTQSSYITKQYYQIMDLMTREILIDIMNLSKIVYKNGLSGSIILGKRLNKIFTALPEHYTFTDFDIHITDTTEIKRQQEVISQLTMELTKGGIADPEVIIELATATGLTEMKKDVLNAIRKSKQENGQAEQMGQQMEQMDQQLKEVSTQAQKLEAEVKRLNEAKLQLENEKLDFEKELEWFKAKDDSAYKESSLELEKQRVQLEGLQLLDNNKNNDEIKNN